MFGLVSKKEYNELLAQLKTQESINIRLNEEIKDLKAELERAITESSVKIKKTTNKTDKKETKKVSDKKTAIRKKKDAK